jgi:sigma-B regulation protein RsbU (phosphoserine phosphatase)
MTLQPGDCLVLVTDGVTEAQDPRGAFFGRDRMPVAAELKNAIATAIVDSIRDEVRIFEGGEEATDDLTVMAVRYLGQP